MFVFTLSICTNEQILGERNDAELSRGIYQTVTSFPDVQGAYDLVLNNYGPDTWNGSIHIEVPDTYSADRLDQLIREITVKVIEEHHVILTAIGGDDTYRLLPYLFENDELKKAATEKVFLGFSDTTINHFMLHKAGMRTFYGQAFLPDLCELAEDMLPYTKQYFKELITTGTIREITPSDVWYEERTEFTPDQVGNSTPSHPNRGYELLQGPTVFSGKILGGCIDSMYDCFCGDRYEDMPVLCRKYHLFPDAKDWEGRIILLETSEEKPAPGLYRQELEYLKATGVFDAVSGILAGKPLDEIYAEEYKNLLVEVIDNPDLPILFNVNIGHALPRCIIPFGVPATVDAVSQTIRFSDAG